MGAWLTVPGMLGTLTFSVLYVIVTQTALIPTIKQLAKDNLKSGCRTGSILKEVGGFHKLEAKNLEGKVIPFSVYQGFVCLVINVASK